MKTITFAQAYELLSTAAAVRLTDFADQLIHISLTEDETFLVLADDLSGIDLHFAEADNQAPQIEGDCLILTPTRGTPVSFVLLERMDLSGLTTTIQPPIPPAP